MNLYDYVAVLDAEQGVAPNAMVSGNKNNNLNDKTATDGTTEKNLYLKAGYVVSLKDNVNYQIAIKKASTEALGTATGSWLTGGWSKQPLMIVEDGFYCIVVRNSPNGTNTAFDFTGKNLYDYVQIEKGSVALEIGQQISSPASKDRATATLNVYLRAGQTVHFKLVGGDYVYGYNLQRLKDGSNAETVPAGNLDGTSWKLSGWGTNDYAVTTEGWYCIVVARTDAQAFDLGGVDPSDLFDYIEIIPTPAA